MLALTYDLTFYRNPFLALNSTNEPHVRDWCCSSKMILCLFVSIKLEENKRHNKINCHLPLSLSDKLNLYLGVILKWL